MVTVKGTKISNRIARDSIKAMERLIYLYEDPKEFTTCPLCPLFTRNLCNLCPWEIIKNTNCRGSHFVDVYRDPERTRNRIRQLRRWIKIYQKALKK